MREQPSIHTHGWPNRTPEPTPRPQAPTAPPRYLLVLRAEPGHWATPPVLRLRAFLKAARRAYGLRCTSCVPAPDSQGGRAATGPAIPPTAPTISGNDAGTRKP